MSFIANMVIRKKGTVRSYGAKKGKTFIATNRKSRWDFDQLR